MSIDHIDLNAYRRYILGKQGLWPSRRWTGLAGTMEALRAVEALQMDPVSVIARSHDIALWGRVHDYQSAFLDQILYQDRRFFDYGSTLFIYPMEEFPYWRVHMEQRRVTGWWADFARENPSVLDFVRGEIRSRGPLRKQDVEGNPVKAYRARKDSGLALHCLWMQGELMTHSRQGIVRSYDLMEKIVPIAYQRTVPESEANTFMIHKAISQDGLFSLRRFRMMMQSAFSRLVENAEANLYLNEMIESGLVRKIEIEGKKETFHYDTSDQPILDALVSGVVPVEWQITEPEPEVVFLSPLEYVSARGRAKELFGVNYTWEIYKPAAKRNFGPYTLPMLLADRIIGRMDARLDRKSKTLYLNGVWFEDWFASNDGFAEAFGRGLSNFLNFLYASGCDLTGLQPSLREQAARYLNLNHPEINIGEGKDIL